MSKEIKLPLPDRLKYSLSKKLIWGWSESTSTTFFLVNQICAEFGTFWPQKCLGAQNVPNYAFSTARLPLLQQEFQTHKPSAQFGVGRRAAFTFGSVPNF